MIRKLNIEFNIKVIKLLIFSKKVVKIEDFIITYSLYLRMKIRDIIVEKQIL